MKQTIRELVINVILFGILGGLISFLGVKANSWPFWAMMLIFSLVYLNGAL